MKTRALLALLICLLAAPTSDAAQKRHRPPSKRPPAEAPTDQAALVGRRAAAARIADEIKTLSHFLYLLGGVVKSVEAVDRAAQESGVPDAAQQAEHNKETIKQSVRNVQTGLNQLENDFSSNAAM